MRDKFVLSKRVSYKTPEAQKSNVETERFVVALKSPLTDGPLDQRQAAVRRCVEQIVVSRNEGQCKITFRKIPTIAGESLAAATDERTVLFGAATGCLPSKH